MNSELASSITILVHSNIVKVNPIINPDCYNNNNNNSNAYNLLSVGVSRAMVGFMLISVCHNECFICILIAHPILHYEWIKLIKLLEENFAM